MEEIKQIPLIAEAIERAEQFDKDQKEKEKSRFVGFNDQTTADMTLAGKKYTQMEMDYQQKKHLERQRENNPFSEHSKKGKLDQQ